MLEIKSEILALKITKNDKELFRRVFGFNTAEAIRSLVHPNVVDIFGRLQGLNPDFVFSPEFIMDTLRQAMFEKYFESYKANLIMLGLEENATPEKIDEAVEKGLLEIAADGRLQSQLAKAKAHRGYAARLIASFRAKQSGDVKFNFTKDSDGKTILCFFDDPV